MDDADSDWGYHIKPHAHRSPAIEIAIHDADDDAGLAKAAPPLVGAGAGAVTLDDRIMLRSRPESSCTKK